MVAVSETCNTRDIAADDPMEKTLAAITGESTSLKVENLSESRRISMIYDLPMPPGYKRTDPGGGDSLPSSSSSISSQIEHGDDMET